MTSSRGMGEDGWLVRALPDGRWTSTIRAGIDLVEMSQMASSIERFGDRFLTRVFTEHENRYCRRRAPGATASFAARFAAKEAVLKVLQPAGHWLDWRTIEIMRLEAGPCELVLHRPAADMARRAGITAWSVSLTHEANYAAAVVVAELDCSKISRSFVFCTDAGAARSRPHRTTREPTRNTMEERIRLILREHGRLAVAVDTLDDEHDLYRAGLTSHASVNVMLALEDEFEVEFPDRMLRRGVFGTIASIRSALDELLIGHNHVPPAARPS